MNETHLPEVLAIERKVFSTPWTEEMFLQEVRGLFGAKTTVAIEGDAVVGYLVAWFIEDEVHLVNVAVDPAFQNEGVGRTLLTDLIEESLERDKTIVTLEVRASNLGAQAFYRRFFFRTIGVRKGYYSDNREDALLMAMDLRTMAHRKKAVEGKSSTR
jgi:ribosomal-protein-alanine N-acetyltransferase